MNKLAQKDRYHFEIEWLDGKVQCFRLSDVQQHCPCACCVEKETLTLNRDVMAHQIKRVGAYALQIQFTTGCSNGIYPFTLLREIGT